MIDKNEMKKKGMKGVKTIIFGRTLIVVFAFLVQFALLTAIYIWLREYSYIFLSDIYCAQRQRCAPFV